MSRVFLLETKAESDPEDHLNESVQLFCVFACVLCCVHVLCLSSRICVHVTRCVFPHRSDLPIFDAIQNKNIEAIRKHAKELDSCFCRQGSSRNDLSIFWIDVAGKHPSPWQFETAMQSPCTHFCKAALQPPFLSKAPARLGVLSALCL